MADYRGTVRARGESAQDWRSRLARLSPENDLTTGAGTQPVPSVPEDAYYDEYVESEWTVAQLKDELERHDLPKSGNKAELVQRLNEASHG